MSQKRPRLLQTYLMDGTLEGIRILDCESTIQAYYVPRLKLSEAKSIAELEKPALYLLLSNEANRVYIGESEKFFTRVSQHAKDDKKQWWTHALAFVSQTDELEKGDVKYLESIAVEEASRGTINLENSTIPPRNNIHRFKLHKIERVLEDAKLITAFLGYDLFRTDETTDEFWYAQAKTGQVSAVFRGDKFIVLAGSHINLAAAPSYIKGWPADIRRREALAIEKAQRTGENLVLKEDVAFRSPNDAGQIMLGRSLNAWTTWKNSEGKTMDEVIRKAEK